MKFVEDIIQQFLLHLKSVVDIPCENKTSKNLRKLHGEYNNTSHIQGALLVYTHVAGLCHRERNPARLRFGQYGAVDLEILSSVYWTFGMPWKNCYCNAMNERRL